MSNAAIDFTSGSPVTGDLPARWIHGSPSVRRNTDPPIHVHPYDEHTFVLRQNKAVHYEAPFLYLFFGNDRALLLDTGATADPGRFPLRDTVDDLIQRWLAKHPRDAYELIVAHTHGHPDHVAGDAQFDGRPRTTVVPADPAAIRSFFGITGWPSGIARLTLGGRELEITGIPGHQEASIAAYDPWTGFLLTGDTVYPGRLYVDDIAAFQDSLDRLVEFARARTVTHVMGCHVEMRRRPGRDYPIGTTYQPDEPPPQMAVERLTAIRDATRAVAGRPGVHVFDDFIIFHGPCRWARRTHAVRRWWNGLRSRIAGG